MSIVHAVFLVLLLKCCLGQESSNCETKETCRDCIQELGCIWCITPKNNKTIHCLSELKSTTNWCAPSELISPKSSISVVQNNPLSSDPNSVTQIRPQKFKVTLRKGEKVTIPFQYEQAKNYPVDLYYIMDLSASMVDHKTKLGKLGQKLADAMRNITKNFRLGFGSFVDKVELPFVNIAPSHLEQPCTIQKYGENIKCVPPYSFINHMSLTEDYKKFAQQVNRAQVSGNIDAPEGGLDALMQAIVCKEEIAWRAHARHLIVFSTDEGFHFAGDGKLAGIVEPNDAKCHMKNNSYTDYLKYDYPSISQINYVAKLNNINIVFAIVKNPTIVDTYKSLSRKIENSNMGTLDRNSENVVNLIIDNYNKIVDCVIISSNATEDVEVKITSTCAYPKENGCSNIHVGEVVNFTATIQALECSPNGDNKKIIAIKPEALHESILIELEVICDCNCAFPGSPYYNQKSVECSGQGNLECGVCNCPPGRFGRECQCDISTGNTGNTTLCQRF